MGPTTAFCTIIARNYLAKALALQGSLSRHTDSAQLHILVIDSADQSDLPEVEGVVWVSPAELGLTDRQVLDLAMIYDVVEFATAVKPLLLKKLLEVSEQAVYLDPDTYVVSPMTELAPAIADSAGGILLTPHFQQPVPASETLFSEGHLLYVGIYNLGFCAVDRRAVDFLAWWWGHLSTECLHSPLDGLFVDQKWVDIGSVLFGGSSFRHYGYNVSVSNLHERPIAEDAEGLRIVPTGDRLRLFHFHSFDANTPEVLCTKVTGRTGGASLESPAVKALCQEYATAVLANQGIVGRPPAYGYGTDTEGRPISRRLRAAYRTALLAGQEPVPSPFMQSEAHAYQEWHRNAWRLIARQLAGDVVKSARLVLPDEFGRLKETFPRLARQTRKRYVARSGIWQ